MKALALLVAIAATAHADTRSPITPPPGWVEADARPAVEVSPVGPPSHFGGTTATFDVTSYAPAASGQAAVSLVVTRVTAPAPTDVPAAVRSEVDQFEGAPRRARLTGSAVAEQAKQERVDAAAKLVEATLAFSDGSVVTSSRLVIAASATRLAAVSGDCISQSGAVDTRVVAQCERALATLEPAIAPSERVAVMLGTVEADPPAVVHELPTMSPSRREPLPPMTVPPSSSDADRRPMVVGAGIVLLAGLFWWNMRRRARLEHEEDPDDR